MKLKKKFMKDLSVVMALVCMVSPVFGSVAQVNTEKEEVVYVNLMADGSVKTIDVVNIFNLEEAKQIVDYGNYLNVRNMTTTDVINYADEMVTLDAPAGRLYYEGSLTSDKEIPWNIEIHYYMNGKEYTAEEIAGMDGALKITLSITENKKCTGNFFDNYSLQASVLLDTNRCKDIKATDATIANVGSDKQLTYTILSGKEAEIEITANVSDFEMNGIAINAIPLNLNVEVDDGELMGQVNELLDAIAELDNGTSELYKGVSELSNKTKTGLPSGIQDLQNGAVQLHDGVANLKEGGSSLNDGVATLQSGVTTLDEGIQSLNEGIQQIQTALNKLNSQSQTLTDGSTAFQTALVQLQTALSRISVTSEDLSALTTASSHIQTGIDTFVNAVTDLQQGVSFEAYKAVMRQNGLDIESLKQNNTEAVHNLQTLILSLEEQVATLQKKGIDVDSLKAQISQLQNICMLLEVNNAAIDGTSTYLSEVNANLVTLLAGAKELQTNYTGFNDEIGKLANILGSLAYQMSELSTAVNTLVSEYGKLDDGIKEYTSAVAQIVVGYSQISEGATALVSGSSSLKSGADSLYSGTDELLSGIVEIYKGTGTLVDGTGKLDEGVAELLSGIAQLYSGSGELKKGTATLRNETAGMDTEIRDKIDGLLESITGGNFETVSFVSDNNTNVDSVQFVIQTEKIECEDGEEVEVLPTEKKNFWQKLIALFN